MKTLFVAGEFNDAGGRTSKITEETFIAINQPDAVYHNGGDFADLEKILEDIYNYNLIYWFADVPNGKPKLIKNIKQQHNACILVTSKRNFGEYSFADNIYHALNNKSNLFVEFTKSGINYGGRIADPLGNVFLDHSKDFTLVGKVLRKRTDELLRYTRLPSQQIGKRKEVPDETEFFSIIKDHAAEFHRLIHAHPETVNRFFGNASFRCEKGFPSFKHNSQIYVSRRNIDKRYIGGEGFVAVEKSLPIRYYGNAKPSVDTPIQIKLYEKYRNVKYILHGHVYIKDAPFTENIVPCGALEEVSEIVNVFPDQKTVDVAINLRGHGSLVLAGEVNRLRGIPYVARTIPEIHRDYAQSSNGGSK